jgi:hypothetical protein
MHEHFVTPDAVYGLILYAALIGAVSDDDSNALEVLIFSGISLIVFWGAHVFAGAIAGHGVKDGTTVTLGHATARAIGHSSGMLYAAILPSVALLLGVFSLISTDDAVSLALLVAMIVLGVLGYNAFAQRGSHVAIRILGALGTALFGLFMIILNIAVH